MKYIFTILTILFLPISSFKEIKPKFCIDCKYFITDNNTDKFGKCSLSPIRENHNYWLVNGIHDIEEYHFCSFVRSKEDMCGNEGKMYKNLIDQEIGHYVPILTKGIKYVIRTEIMYGGKQHIPSYKECRNIKIVKLN